MATNRNRLLVLYTQEVVGSSPALPMRNLLVTGGTSHRGLITAEVPTTTPAASNARMAT